MALILVKVTRLCPNPEPKPVHDKLSFPFEKRPKKGISSRLQEGVFWIQMPLFFELDHINLWLLDDGDGWVLVDTSIHTKEMCTVWET